jgi:hypothetical protein
VQESQSNGRESVRRGTLRRAALVPAAAVAVLAFAAPAHAGKPVHPPAVTPPPAPVAPVEESVSTVPEEVSAVPETTDAEVPEMGVTPGASAPPVAEPAQPAEVEAPVEVAAPKPAVQLPKEPANAGSWVRVRTVRPRPVERHVAPQRAAISPPRPVAHVQAPVARRHVHKPARHAARTSAGRWYQVPAAQYQRSADRAATSRSKSPPTRPQTGSTTDRHVPSRVSLRVRGKPPDGSSNCVRKGIECLDSCTDNAGWKVGWNGRWISGCTSPNDAAHSAHEGRNSESDGQVDRGASASGDVSGPQYQCPGAQYHDYWCDEGVSGSPDDETDADNETDADTDTPDDEPASSCSDTAAPGDADHDEDDSDADVGDWDRPHHSPCDQSFDTPVTPGGTQPPTGKPGPTAQVPQPPAPPAPAAPTQLPPAPPPTEQPAAPSPTEQPSAPPPPDQPPPGEASAPPPAEPAPAPSAPAAEPAPKNTRAARGGTRQESSNPTGAVHRAAAVVQPSSRVVPQASPVGTVRPSAKPKPVAGKARAAKKPERRQAPPTSAATPPATDRSALQRPRATRPVASTSQSSRDWLLLLAMTLFGLSVLAFALAAVSEVGGGTPAVTMMRSRLGSKGLSARRVGLKGGNDGAASSRATDTIRYRD